MRSSELKGILIELLAHIQCFGKLNTYKSICFIYKMTKAPKKDYAYRSTWKHKFSRARNLAHRGGLTKKEMFKKYGRFPKKNEWWGEDGSYKVWKEKWIVSNPK
jgi:hypothetical protein